MIPARLSVRLLVPPLLGGGAVACGPRPTPPQRAQGRAVVDGLVLAATTRVWGAAPESVGVRVRVTNQRPDTADLRYGACVLEPTFVRVAGADSRPGGSRGVPAGARWEGQRQTVALRERDGSVRRVHEECVMIAFGARLAPGASAVLREFTWRAALDAVRGDSLRGTYQVVARLHQILGRDAVDVPAGTVRLP